MVLKEASVGTEVSLRISGFTARVVTVQVCGNEGRRGSVDCNVTEATTIDVPAERTSFLSRFTVARPPTPCPCIVQVSSERFDEVAVAGFTLLGHPTGALVDTGRQVNPLQVSVAARRVERGFWGALRTSLGGPTSYDVVVTVKNASTSTVRAPHLGLAVGRDAEDEIQTIDVPALGDLAPQESKRQVVRTQLPSPVYGAVVWRATTTAYGLTTTATASTQNRPLLLVVFAALFSACVLALVLRVFLRMVRRARGRRRGGATTQRRPKRLEAVA